MQACSLPSGHTDLNGKTPADFMGSWIRSVMKAANSGLVQAHRSSKACLDLLNKWNHQDFCTLQEQTPPWESWKWGNCKISPSHSTAATLRIETRKAKKGAFGIEVVSKWGFFFPFLDAHLYFPSFMALTLFIRRNSMLLSALSCASLAPNDDLNHIYY